ncbi:hypothetical protein BC629DRAFT_353044 [Irpex lacteus]|nr:hypothetical protein BC629DRAFT_353044 [Irpex lacteus]
MQGQVQPEAYMPLPEMGSLSLEAPSASQDGDGASQPSAYNDQPPASASRLHPGDIVFASVAYNYSSATPPPPGQAPPPRLGSSQAYPYFNFNVPSANHGTSESIEGSELGEIPGFGTRAPPKHDTAREEGEEAEPDRSSSPIQDFTTSIIGTSARHVADNMGEIPGFGTRPPPRHLLSIDTTRSRDQPSNHSSSPIQGFTTSIISARPNAQPLAVAETVGPRWKFPSNVRLQNKPEKGKEDGDGEGGEEMRDVTSSSSPILDFTTSVLVGDVVGAGGSGAGVGTERDRDEGGEEIWRVPGLQESQPQSQSHIQEEPGLGLSGIPEERAEQSAVLKLAIEGTSESAQIRTGEGAQPRETWSGSESLELYGNQPGGTSLAAGHEGGGMDVDAVVPPPPVGNETKPLTRMSTDEQLYGSLGKSLPDLEDGDGGKTPTQEQPNESLQRQGSTNSSSAGASSKRSRSPDARGASAHIQRVEEGTKSPSRKRRRLESGALYDLIAGPHLYTVPSPPATPAPKTLQLPEEANAKAYTALNTPQILPSSGHTPESIAKLFKDPYARCAWIVPVRGTPPFPGCTAASVLDTSSSSPTHPTSSGSNTRKVSDLPSGPTSNVAHQDAPGAITWTGDALRAFWKFLFDVREAGQMGPVALSFHCANGRRTTTRHRLLQSIRRRALRAEDARLAACVAV